MPKLDYRGLAAEMAFRELLIFLVALKIHQPGWDELMPDAYEFVRRNHKGSV